MGRENKNVSMSRLCAMCSCACANERARPGKIWDRVSTRLLCLVYGMHPEVFMLGFSLGTSQLEYIERTP